MPDSGGKRLKECLEERGRGNFSEREEEGGEKVNVKSVGEARKEEEGGRVGENEAEEVGADGRIYDGDSEFGENN